MTDFALQQEDFPALSSTGHPQSLQRDVGDVVPIPLTLMQRHIERSAAVIPRSQHQQQSIIIQQQLQHHQHQQHQQQQQQHNLAVAPTQSLPPSHSKKMILRRPHASGPDRYGLAGLLPVIRMRDIDVTLITLGTDLTTLGVNLTSSDVLYATFAYPCAETPMSHEPKYVVPRCYQQHSAMIFKQQNIHKIQLETLFYIFYSMPNDIMQALAAREIYARDWRYHKILHLWMVRVPLNTLPLQLKASLPVELITSANAANAPIFIYFDPVTFNKRVFCDVHLLGPIHHFMTSEELINSAVVESSSSSSSSS